jgi:hypothetical protein
MASEFENYDTVVVNLEPSSDGSNGVTTATYDQAFLGEEFSELRGRGRARRQARRQERRMTRVSNRQKRKSARQAMRAEQQEARQLRKDTRKSRHLNRKSMGEEEDAESTENDGADNSADTGSDTGADQGYDSGSDTGSDTGYDSGSDSGEDQGYDSGEDQDGGYEEADESFAGDSSNFSAEVTGRPSVPNDIQAIANKIELTDQMINQLMQYKKMLESRGKSTAKISSMIGAKSNQLEYLESKLDNFSGADGSVDPMKEKVIDIATQKAKTNVTKRKIAWHQDKIASLRQQRNALPKGGGNNLKHQQLQNQIDNHKGKIADLQGQLSSGFSGDDMSFATGLTPAQLKAKIAWHKDKIASLRQQRNALPKGAGNNLAHQKLQNQIARHQDKIVELQGQLGTSGFDGDFDSPAFDYDQPQSQIVDLDAPSNFSGSDSSNNYLKTLLIGGAIAIATIYVVRKYNLLK